MIMAIATFCCTILAGIRGRWRDYEEVWAGEEKGRALKRRGRSRRLVYICWLRSWGFDGWRSRGYIYVNYIFNEKEKSNRA